MAQNGTYFFGATISAKPLKTSGGCIKFVLDMDGLLSYRAWQSFAFRELPFFGIPTDIKDFDFALQNCAIFCKFHSPHQFHMY